MLGGLSSSLLVAQIEKIFFQIWAPSLSVTTFYEYSSVGVGKGAGASMSATLEGPFNDFSTTSAISTTDFGGAARFTTSGVGPFSVNFLNLMGEPDPPPDLGLADRAPTAGRACRVRWPAAAHLARRRRRADRRLPRIGLDPVAVAVARRA
jgi:hypothetical protein